LIHDYTLKRSNRKTVAIHIRDGLVEVRAPYSAPIASIESFIFSKERWIEEKLMHSRLRISNKEQFSLDYGSLLVYRGFFYPIVGKPENTIGFDDDEGSFYMPLNLTPEQIKKYCVEIYKMLAKRDITERVYKFSSLMQVSAYEVKVNSAKTRWGSCSSKRSLNFSWTLIMADDEAIDYIVVHELAHIAHMNHSSNFWALVRRYVPDFEQHKARLKELQRRLSNEDWN